MAVQPTYARRQLGAALKRLRTAADLSMEDAADALDWSRTKILRGEAGTVKITPHDLGLLVDLYGAESEEAARLGSLLQDSRSSRWWDGFEPYISVTLDEFLSLESRASAIHLANTGVFPGIVQSPAYAAAVFEASGQVPDPDVRDALVELRLRRAKRAFRGDDFSVNVVLGGALFYVETGGRATLRGQIQHVLDLCDAPGTCIQVIPLSAPTAVMAGGLIMLDFDEPHLSSVAYAEHQAGMTLVDLPLDVRRLKRGFDHLKSQALSPESTRKFLSTRLEEL